MGINERLTPRARKTLERAAGMAGDFGHPEPGAEELFLSLMDEDVGLASEILRALGLNTRTLAEAVRRALNEETEKVFIPYEEVIDFASQEAQALGHSHVGTEHLLMGVLNTACLATPVLLESGVDIPQTKATLKSILKERGSFTREGAAGFDLILPQREDLEDRSERFTERAIRAMQEAKRLAGENGWPLASTGHLLAVILQDDHSMACQVLVGMGISRQEIRTRLVGKIPPDHRPKHVEEVPLSPNTMDAIEAASQEARSFDHDHVGTGHLLVGLMMVPLGAAWDVLNEAKVSPDEARGILIELLAGHPQGWSQMLDEMGESIPGWQQRVTANREVRNVLERAFHEAEIQGKSEVSTEHLLLGMLGAPRSKATTVLRALGISLKAMKADIVSEFPEKSAPKTEVEPRLSGSSEQALFYAAQETAAMGHTSMGTEELLLGLVRSLEGSAAKRLRTLGLTPMRLRADILRQWSAWETAKREEILIGSGSSVWSSLWEAASVVNGARRMAEHLSLVSPDPESEVETGLSTEQFSQDMIRILTFAQKHAAGSHVAKVQTDHLLLALLEEESPAVNRILDTLKIDRHTLQNTLFGSEHGLQGETLPSPLLPYAADAECALAIACLERLSHGHSVLAPHHLLIGIVIAENSRAAHLFAEARITPERIREAIKVR